MALQHLDLTSELLAGMRLSGVSYRRIESGRPFGVEFSAVAGKAQFHFISRGPVLLRTASGQQFNLESGDALFIPNGSGHFLLSDERATSMNVLDLPTTPVCSTVCCVKNGCETAADESAIIFSGCMDFELGGMQPLVKAMPEVMLVSRLLTTWPEIHPLLTAMERESLTRQAGYAGILHALRTSWPRSSYAVGWKAAAEVQRDGYRCCAIQSWGARSMRCIRSRVTTGK